MAKRSRGKLLRFSMKVNILNGVNMETKGWSRECYRVIQIANMHVHDGQRTCLNFRALVSQVFFSRVMGKEIYKKV